MGIYGYNRNTTPNIDNWAKEAQIYNNAFTNYPSTLQSFYSLFSGRRDFVFDYEKATNYIVNFDSKKADYGISSLAKILKDHGYYTTAIVTNPMLGSKFNFFKDGFNEFYFENKPNISDDEESFAYDYEKSLLATEKTLEWIDKNSQKKFFLWIHYDNPHMPYNPPKEYICKIDNNCGDLEKYKDLLEEKKSFSRILKSCTNGEISNDLKQAAINLYDAEILSADEQIGILLQKFKEKNLLEKTVVVFYSDHGEAFDHDFFGHGWTLYNSTNKIAFILSNPLNKSNKILKNYNYIDNVNIRDIILYNLGIVNDSNQIFPAKNDEIILHASFDNSDKYALIKDNYKYIFTHTANINNEDNQGDIKELCDKLGDKEELYNLELDPNEEKNAIQEQKTIRDSLKEILFKKVNLSKLFEQEMNEENKKEIKERLKSIGY